MKKALSVFLCAALVTLMLGVSAFAADSAISVRINGTDVSFADAAPEIVSRGFVYMRDSEELIADTKALLIKDTRKFEGADRGDYASIKAGIKNSLKTFLKNRTKRTPMIMTIIMMEVR